ncbi:MAG: Uma2 family endonuclease [Thermoguttaceae bacterium]
MATVVLLEQQVEIPQDLRSLADFRRWALSAEFPEQGRIDYLGGRIEVDMSPEDLHTHGKLKTELVAVLWQRIKEKQLGELYTDRARVSCPEADLSVEPDLVFVAEESLNSHRVRLVPKAGGEADRYAEMEGAPDLVVEIISDASVRKDTRRLPAAYIRAGVREFWLIDARGPELLFQIYTPDSTGYQSVAPDAEGFQRSEILGCGYRLNRGRNLHGRLTFDLVSRT